MLTEELFVAKFNKLRALGATIAIRWHIPYADIDDLVQRSLYKLYDNRLAFRESASLTTWFSAIVKHTLQDYLYHERIERQPHARHMYAMLERVDTPEEAFLGKEEAYEDQRRITRITNAVTRLPQCQQDVYNLRVNEGLPFRLIAKRLGMPLNTTRTYYHRAVESLKRRVGSDEERKAA